MSARGLRYLITGPRDFSDWGLVRRVIAVLPPGSTVIHGDARGADTLVHRVLTQNPPRRARNIRVHGSSGAIGRGRGGSRRGDIDIEVYPADWDRYRPVQGRRNPAGAIRNRVMRDDGNPDRCIYFGEGDTPGTGGMIRLCLERDIPVWGAREFVDFMRDGGDGDDDDESGA